jgi:hypothetical protein
MEFKPTPKPVQTPAVPTALEVLIMLQNQNTEIIKQLRNLNSKVSFFVWLAGIMIVLQVVSWLFR